MTSFTAISQGKYFFSNASFSWRGNSFISVLFFLFLPIKLHRIEVFTPPILIYKSTQKQIKVFKSSN